MNRLFCLASVAAALLLVAPGAAMAQSGSSTLGHSANRQQPSGHPTGMTGHFRGWQSAQGSGSGANNFVGNGRGHPGGNANAGHFGGWFANNHDGGNRH